ncbi:metallophosphoesterase family protein [Petrachloros mirabilis]
MSRSQVLRIGVIADTHGLFDQAILRHFQSVDHILHAGDIGGGWVIEKLRAIAPVTVVSGNVDGYEQSGHPSERIIRLAGRRIAIRHILFEGSKLTKEGRTFLEREQPDLCIFGHTHQQKLEWLGKTLLVNPGSAGPKRFKLTRGIALLHVSNRSVEPRLIPLSDRAEPR